MRRSALVPSSIGVAVLALVPHMPRYHRSMTAYAHEIAGDDA